MDQESGGKPTVWQMVGEAVQALGGSTTNAAVRRWVWDRYPGTNRSTIDCQMIAGTVNHPSRVHYGIDARPRPANNPQLDVYYRPARGQIERYDPDRHGRWEIYAADNGKLSVRPVNEWPAVAPVPQATATAPMAEVEAQPIVGGEGEVTWMKQLQPVLEAALQFLSLGNTKLRVDSGYRLPYAHEVMSYKDDQPHGRRMAKYQTDLLVYDEVDGGAHWVPRVVIECKIKGVTTHDALTYSGKAATHKQVHPYLRYGILVGSFGTTVPMRLVRHGAYFDFMAVWRDAQASEAEWKELLEVLRLEVEASRLLQELLTGGKGTKPFRLLHRPLQFKG